MLAWPLIFFWGGGRVWAWRCKWDLLLRLLPCHPDLVLGAKLCPPTSFHLGVLALPQLGLFSGCPDGSADS